MMLAPGAASLLNGFDMAALTTTTDTVYLLSPHLELLGYNPAFTAFAERNGAPDLTARYPLGSSILTAFPDAVADLYRARYLEALTTNTPFAHDYECSSPTVHRQYRQVAYPLGEGAGLLVTNSLTVERPAPPGHTAPCTAYRDAAGTLDQCCHCRRVHHRISGRRWDWVPELVATPLPAARQHLCPYCAAQYGRALNGGEPLGAAAISRRLRRG